MNTKIDALNYYGATKKYPLHFPALQEDIDADVVIIGGGFSGINTALELAEQGSLMLSFWKPAILGMAAPGETAVR
ncbi:putative oxidoreductase [Salmonella enterica subsp. enterica serovar Sanjuan]|uniref:Putative oxidoreductase n=1 Tax=Salmonella enterica subsp. enterica serovar Sanjuan TaxID=1160765 RepID=A0A447NJ57_SALET|nr:putative oxidoreductase [Salmonella enterica subsp. enterica serovar Sanjuan]